MAPKFVTDADGWTTRASKRSQGTQHVATLILRPPTGLFLPQWSPRTLHDALSVSAALTAAEARAATLQRINETTLNGKTYPVHIYIASPHNSCRGVIHNVELNTPTEELMRELRAPNYEIIAARMMGKTSTAIITFKGSHVPRQVIFGGGVYRCVPHRPKAQFCSTCFAIGHRSDVCRDSGKPRCRTCGKTVGDPVDDHDCKPGCPNCGKDHKADDPTCEVRQAADKAVREAAYLKRLQQREDDKQTNTVTIASRSPSPKRNSDNISTDRSRQHQSGNYSKSGSRVQSGDRSRPGGRNQSPDHSQTRGQQQEQPTIQQNYIAAQDRRPDILLLQETNQPPHVTGYTTYSHNSTLAILIRKDIAANIVHSTEQSLTVRVFPTKIDKRKAHPQLFITNIYSPPKQKVDFFKEVANLRPTKYFDHLIAGDFNAPHTSWGYTKNSPKGSALLHHMQQAQLTLLNETDSPTRHGNSVERDTMPDLAFIKGRLSAQWVNTHDTLTSDHTLIQIFLQVKGFPKRQRKHRLTDWDEFRKQHEDFQDMNLKDWRSNSKLDGGAAYLAPAPAVDIPAGDP
ncbi:hypothetical protein HPB49_023867 [Dermacentor silvarum]|uniref:Uncharacterized protein n=1 Tax=Dermacentor silvarum TaxID=543639 RepID=A0ACB8CC37_DERSI|nr:hypothetical protein HPB49_023867 [Dermacentor silvarum]